MNKKRLNRLLLFIVILLVLIPLNYGFDLLLPVLDRSPLWHGIVIAAGVCLLLFVPLLYLLEKTDHKNSILTKILLLTGFFLLGTGVTLNGASLWWNEVETLSFLLIGAGIISWAASFFLVFRAESMQKKLTITQS